MWVYNPWLRRIQKKLYTYSNMINRQINSQLLNITGIWDSNFGKMVFRQEGSNVTGYYYRSDGIINGIITEENILNADWKQEPTMTDGTTSLLFTLTEFAGTWGYNDQPHYYNWVGSKISSSFIGQNCFRYRIRHDLPELPEVIVNDESINYGEQTSYFYPEECSDFTEFKLFISGEIISEKIPVEPGYSYTFVILGTLPNIKIDVTIDNPF